MNANPTLNDTLKTAYNDAAAHIRTTPKFNAMYQCIVKELTVRANNGNRTPFQMQVGYDMLYPMVDKLTADGLEVSHLNDTIEARIKIA